MNNKQKGFGIIGIFLVITIIGIIGGGIFYVNNSSNSLPEDTSITPEEQPSIVEVAKETPIESQKNNTSENIQIPQENTNLREDVFKTVTSSRWCKPSEGFLPSTGRSYEFTADGQFKWSHFSDYLEGSGQGSWNFKMYSETGGYIFLSSGELWRFDLQENGNLLLRGSSMDSCGALATTENFSASDLPQIDGPDFLDKLNVNTWYSTNSGLLGFYPTSIEFTRDGTMRSTYRYGECVENYYVDIDIDDIKNGRIAFSNEEPDHKRYTLTWSPIDYGVKNCDTRDDDLMNSVYSYEAKFEDNLFFLGSRTYTAYDMRKEGQELIVLPNYGPEMWVRYSVPIIVGEPVTFNISIKNGGPYTLNRFSITKEYEGRNYKFSEGEESFAPGTPSFIRELTSFPSNELAAKDFDNQVLPREQDFEFDIDLIFDESGTQALYLNLLAYNERQLWNNFERYEFDVQP